MRVILIGNGKMGQAITQILKEKKHTIVAIIDVNNLPDFNGDLVKKADVVIEFTHPTAAPKNILKCFELSIPVVCGTTGWLDQWDTIITVCKEKKGGLLYASNFSIGTNIFFEINKKLASLMKDQTQYQLHIQEVHHTEKKDTPSGTAIRLAEDIIEQNNHKTKWQNHSSINDHTIGIISKRIGTEAGTHQIIYHSNIDEIEITHRAFNRVGFASGAVLAAEFIIGKKGIYSMKEVLGI